MGARKSVTFGISSDSSRESPESSVSTKVGTSGTIQAPKCRSEVGQGLKRTDIGTAAAAD